MLGGMQLCWKKVIITELQLCGGELQYVDKCEV